MTVDGKHPNTGAIAGLAAAIVVPLLPIGEWLAPGQSLKAMLVHDAVWWCYGMAVIFWLRFGEHLPLSSIGLRIPTWKTWLGGVLGGVALVACFMLCVAVIFPLLHVSTAQSAAERNVILSKPLWYRFELVLRATVVEEILFRGYMIEKVRQLSGSIFLACLVSVLVFTYAHLSAWGLAHLIPVGLSAVILALLYAWKRDLPANMVAHFIIDGAGFLLG